MFRNIIILIWREKNTNLVKQVKIISQGLKAIENPNDIVYIKSVIIEYPKTSHKLSKTIRQDENFSNSHLYIETKNKKIFLDGENNS